MGKFNIWHLTQKQLITHTTVLHYCTAGDNVAIVPHGLTLEALVVGHVNM